MLAAQSGTTAKTFLQTFYPYLQMVTAFNAYVLVKDLHPATVKQEWQQFQDFIEDRTDSVIGELSSQKSVPLQRVPVPVNRHQISAVLFEKKKSCQGCRAKASLGQRVAATLQGCKPCRMAVCKKCVSDHIQRVNL